MVSIRSHLAKGRVAALLCALRFLNLNLNHNLTLTVNRIPSRQFEIKIRIRIKKTQTAEERLYASFGQMGTN